MKKALIRSSIFRYAEIVIIMATSLVLTPYLISQLGDLDYGLWILVLSTLGWFSFVDLGFSSAVKRQITFAIENNDDEGVNTVFSCSLILFAVLGSVATIGVFIIGVFPQILGVPHDRLETASIIITILCLKMFMDFLMNAMHGIFSGHIRYDIDANIGSVATLLKAGLVFSVVDKYGLFGVVFATMVADILNNFTKIYYAKRIHKTLLFSWKLVTMAEIKGLFSFSKHVIASIIARSINTKSDPIIIANILDLSAITMFNVADRLANMIENLVKAIVDVFEPVFYKQVAKNMDIKQTFNLVISINFFIAGIFFIPLAVLADDFIILWVGEKYSFSSTLTFILVFAFLAKTISRPITSLLLAKAQHKLMSVVNLMGAIFNISLSIILGIYYGLIGIVISTSISFILSDVCLYLIMLRHYTQIPITYILIKFLLLNLLYIVMFIYGDHFLIQQEAQTWLVLVINSLIIFIINFVICWTLLLSAEAKEKIIGLFRKKCDHNDSDNI